jgi:hypothetical protein
LVLRPGNKAHWVAYANACHMLGDYTMALKIIDDFLANMKVRLYEYCPVLKLFLFRRTIQMIQSMAIWSITK